MRCEPHLRVLDGGVVGLRRPTRVATDAADGVRELALTRFDGRDALGQLESKSPQLLLGGDADRAQALVLGLDRDRLVLLLAEQGHASMICAGRSFSCFGLRGALEALFRASATDDLLALAEAEPGLLDAKRLPELLQTFVELLDLALNGRVEPLGEALPELLALLRDALDLDM